MTRDLKAHALAREKYRDWQETRREAAYAKAYAAIEVDPQGETVFLPLMSPSKAMLLNKQMEASNEK